jgi:type III secretion protein V
VTAGAGSSVRARAAEAWLAALVVLVVVMMIVPLPTALLDLLLATNLGISLLLLLSALAARSPLALSSLPTLLLVTTLFRLSLNVSSTRLILLQADAGRVIAAFGDFVVRGNYAVGAIVFLVLTIVQYVVIARGSERVAEVAARFALDALPGRQMAIDAELRAGALTAEEARRKRAELSRESSLYGALDGAMKFVKGDAIAGLVILVVNLVGGVGSGVGLRDLGVVESLRTYGLLTIGDGLVTQIPSLLVSTAAGIVVTRVASAEGERPLGAEIAEQILGSRRTLGIASGVLGALALVPGLPTLPFLALAGLLAGLAWRAGRAPSAEPRALVSLEVSADVLPARALPDAAEKAREAASATLGVPLPRVAARSVADAGLVRASVEGLKSVTVPASAADAPAAMVTALVRAARRDTRLVVGADAVAAMVDVLSRERPALVRQAMPRPLTLAALTEVVRALVAEGIPPRPMASVVEAAMQPTGHTGERDAIARLENVRAALARTITAERAPTGALEVLELDGMLEEALRDGLTRTSASVHLAVPPALARDVVAALRKQPSAPVLLVAADLRPHLRALLAPELPDLTLLAPKELDPTTRITTVARVVV